MLSSSCLLTAFAIPTCQYRCMYEGQLMQTCNRLTGLCHITVRTCTLGTSFVIFSVSIGNETRLKKKCTEGVTTKNNVRIIVVHSSRLLFKVTFDSMYI